MGAATSTYLIMNQLLNTSFNWITPSMPRMYGGHQWHTLVNNAFTLGSTVHQLVSDSVWRRLESRSSGFQTLSELVQFFIHLAPRSNVFSFSFKRIWLLIRTRLAFHSNAFGYLFKHIWLLVWTSFVQRSNASIHGPNAFGQKTLYTLCLTGTVYDVPASRN